MKTDFPTMRLLAEAVKLSGGPQRDMLRKIVSRMINSADPDEREEFDKQIKGAILHSPICGDGDDQINPKATALGVLKSMSNDTLMALARGDRELKFVPAAIEHPVDASVTDTSTTTGFRFGWAVHSDKLDPGGDVKDYMEWATDQIWADQEGEFQEKYRLGTFDSVEHVSDDNDADISTTINDMTLETMSDMFTKLVAEAINAQGKGEDDVVWSFQNKEDKDRYLNVAEQVRDAMKEAVPEAAAKADGAMMLLAQQVDEPNYDAAAEMELSPEAQAVADMVTANNALFKTTGPVEDDDDDAPATSIAPFEVSLDPSLASGINSLLKGATGGVYEGLDDILKAASADAAQRVQVDVQKALKDIKARPAVTEWKETATTTASTEIPEGEVSYKRAFEVFTKPDGKKFGGKVKKMLDFDVPLWVWDGKHPNVPEVDPHYIFDPKTLIQFLQAIRQGRNPWLYGHTGTGKSTFVTQVAARLSQPMLRINFDSEMTRLDLVGREVLLNDGGTTISKFVDGVLPTAIAGPYWLLCDEQSYIRADVAFVYQRVLEEGKTLMLTEDAGRTVHPHPFFRIIATCNTKGQGDEFGCYQGARPQAASFLDRFRPFLEIDYLEPGQEKELVTMKVPGIDDAAADKLVQFANDARKSFTNMETQMPVSPRGVLAVAEDYVFYADLMDDKEAMQLALHSNLLDRASTQDRVLLKGIADRVLA